MMVAYLDESGNSGRAETITISGIVARASEWKRLQKKMAKSHEGIFDAIPSYGSS